ncbi:MAG: hypothetical protein H0W63_03875 [Gemmatimonadaceae bacterium]|nr:hypothetical protein [Gemmatimonadaceae bacterium]
MKKTQAKDVGVLNELRLEVAPATAQQVFQAEQVRAQTQQALELATDRVVGLLNLVVREKGHGEKKLQLVEVTETELVFRVEKAKA